MEELYIAILKRIENEMPEIAYIDEDYGQLEGMNSENEDFYPVTFPCVLVGNTEADWKDIGLGTQAGEITLTVRLGIDCYHDTHIGSGTTGRSRNVWKWPGNYTGHCKTSSSAGTWTNWSESKAGIIPCPETSRCMNLCSRSAIAMNLRYWIAGIVREQGKLFEG